MREPPDAVLTGKAGEFDRVVISPPAQLRTLRFPGPRPSAAGIARLPRRGALLQADAADPPADARIARAHGPDRRDDPVAGHGTGYPPPRRPGRSASPTKKRRFWRRSRAVVPSRSFARSARRLAPTTTGFEGRRGLLFTPGWLAGDGPECRRPGVVRRRRVAHPSAEPAGDSAASNRRQSTVAGEGQLPATPWSCSDTFPTFVRSTKRRASSSSR